jgi:hypothetical protein
MSWLKKVSKGIVQGIKDSGKALDPTSGMSGTERLEAFGRGSIIAGSGGMTEVARHLYEKGSAYGAKHDPTKKAQVEELDAGQYQKIAAPDFGGGVGGKAGTGSAAPQFKGATVGKTLTADQQASLAMAKQMAQGKGVSAAEVMARQQGDKIARQQMGAATARGFNPAAMRGAMYQGQQAQSEAAQAGVLARAQEQMQGQQLYGQQAMGMAQMQQQDAQLQAQLSQAAAQGNAELMQQINIERARLAMQASLANQQAGEARALANMGAKNQAAFQAQAMKGQIIGGVLSGAGQVGAAGMTGGGSALV